MLYALTVHSTLLEMPAHLHAVILSAANHTAAEKKCRKCPIMYNMLVLCILETDDLLGVSHTTVPRFYTSHQHLLMRISGSQRLPELPGRIMSH